MQLLNDLNYPFNIISLSETWLRSNEQISNLDLPGYSFLSQPTTQRAGGVGLYIRNGIQFSVRHDLTSSTGESEMLWVEIESDLDSNMICGVVYRHPSSNLETFLNNFYSVIGKISQEGKLCLISGDFNINLLNYDKHPLTEDFINTLGSFFLEPLLKPTRITSHSSTLIDNIFFNFIEYQAISGNLLHDLTDHLPNFLIIERFAFSRHKEKKYKRDYSNYNEEAFINEFSSIDWSDLFHGLSDTTEMFDKFYTEVNNVINSHYYKEHFVINKAKTKEIWKGIKQLICLKSKGSTLPSKLIINEHEITNHKVIADQFNKFFSNIGKNLASAVPKPNLAFDHYLDKPQASSFFL